MDPKTPKTDEEKRQEVSEALLRIAAGVEQYDWKNFNEALNEWNKLTKKAEEE